MKTAKLRDRLWEHPQLIDDYLEGYGHNLSQEEVATVNLWKDRISGRFIILKQLKKQAIFIHLDDGEKIYGVLGLESSMAEMTQIMDMPFPLMVNAVLLPFDGKVVYDGFLKPYAVSFGRGVRSDFNDLYRDVKSENRIIAEITRD